MPKKKTHGQFVSEVFEQVGEEYAVIGEYMGASRKILLKHYGSCGGYEFEVPSHTFLLGHGRCPVCTPKSKRITHKDFLWKLENLFPGEYEVIGEYRGSATSITMKHLPCGTLGKRYPYAIYRGHGCKVCANKRVAKTHEVFVKELKDISFGEFECVNTYSNSSTPVVLKHIGNDACNLTFEAVPNKVLCNGVACPHCYGHRSVGEFKIKQWLIKNNIVFEQEYSYSDLYDLTERYPLRFDFALFEKGKVSMLIEFDGKQHFKANTSWGNFEDIQRRDQKKNSYCSDLDISLLRIAYTQVNAIEEILLENIDVRRFMNEN